MILRYWNKKRNNKFNIKLNFTILIQCGSNIFYIDEKRKVLWNSHECGDARVSIRHEHSVYIRRSVSKYLSCVVREIRDTEEKSFSGLARTIYAGIREISAHDSSEFRKLVTFLERNDKLELELARSLARPPRQLGMSYSPWTSGKLYLREAVITNPVEIVRKLETWNNFTAFKPGSTLCGANRCDDNSLILENSHSTGRGNYFSFIHPSLSRQTLSKATVSLSLSISPFLSLCPVAFDYSRESSRAKRNRQRYRFVFRDFDLEGKDSLRGEKRERERLNTGKNERWNFMKEISQGRQEIEIERYPGNWNGPTATAPNLCVTILLPSPPSSP